MVISIIKQKQIKKNMTSQQIKESNIQIGSCKMYLVNAVCDINRPSHNMKNVDDICSKVKNDKFLKLSLLYIRINFINEKTKNNGSLFFAMFIMTIGLNKYNIHQNRIDENDYASNVEIIPIVWDPEIQTYKLVYYLINKI